MKRILPFLLLAGLALVLAACNSQQTIQPSLTPTSTPNPTPAASIVTISEVLKADSRFSMFYKALNDSGAIEVLQGDGPYTIFAPTNDTFEKLSADTLEGLYSVENKAELREMMLYHIVEGKYTYADLQSLTSLPTASGLPLAVYYKDGKVSINAAYITRSDVVVKDGIIHIIDTILVLPFN